MCKALREQEAYGSFPKNTNPKSLKGGEANMKQPNKLNS